MQAYFPQWKLEAVSQWIPLALSSNKHTRHCDITQVWIPSLVWKAGNRKLQSSISSRKLPLFDHWLIFGVQSVQSSMDHFWWIECTRGCGKRRELATLVFCPGIQLNPLVLLSDANSCSGNIPSSLSLGVSKFITNPITCTYILHLCSYKH